MVQVMSITESRTFATLPKFAARKAVDRVDLHMLINVAENC